MQEDLQQIIQLLKKYEVNGITTVETKALVDVLTATYNLARARGLNEYASK